MMTPNASFLAHFFNSSQPSFSQEREKEKGEKSIRGGKLKNRINQLSTDIMILTPSHDICPL